MGTTEIHVSRIGRALKHDGFYFFSVRNHNNKSYGQGKKLDNDIYDINGFQIRFFTKEHMRAIVEEGFEILDIKEIYEDPVTLYLVSTRKTFANNVYLVEKIP
jgi:hypothetical protein